MPRPILATLLLLTLAACGADGPPTAPGVTVTGEASVGITGSAG
ncbi:MAG: hypothetical protein RIT14_891 [Pseudomonadota bacterium]|jgi:predicted small lipoprotein YifL